MQKQNLPPRIQKFLDENEDVTVAHVIMPDGKVHVVLAPILRKEEDAKAISALINQIIDSQEENYDLPF